MVRAEYKRQQVETEDVEEALENVKVILNMTERWLVLLDQQAASLLSVVVVVFQGFGLTHCQVESYGKEAEQEAG